MNYESGTNAHIIKNFNGCALITLKYSNEVININCNNILIDDKGFEYINGNYFGTSKPVKVVITEINEILELIN